MPVDRVSRSTPIHLTFPGPPVAPATRQRIVPENMAHRPAPWMLQLRTVAASCCRQSGEAVTVPGFPFSWGFAPASLSPSIKAYTRSDDYDSHTPLVRLARYPGAGYKLDYSRNFRHPHPTQLCKWMTARPYQDSHIPCNCPTVTGALKLRPYYACESFSARRAGSEEAGSEEAEERIWKSGSP